MLGVINGKRRRGCPCTHWLDTIKRPLPTFWTLVIGSMERCFPADQKRCGYTCCLHPTPVWMGFIHLYGLVSGMPGQVTVHGPGVGAPCSTGCHWNDHSRSEGDDVKHRGMESADRRVRVAKGQTRQNG